MTNNDNVKTMDGFSPKTLQEMDARGINKYYVYGLLDPSDPGIMKDPKNPDYSNPFYVGKGCGNRVFDHAKAAIKADKKEGEDNISLKLSTIQEIMGRGDKVLCVIYRWGLTEDEALIVESVLIDCLPGLTNIQSGYKSSDYGMITAEDLQNRLDIQEYEEPKENYIIIKTSKKAIEANGDLYEATRRCWKATLSTAKRYKYVLAVMNGVVREVYEVSEWHTSATEAPRIEFTGKETDNEEMLRLKGKRLPEKYMKRGAANPFMYKKQE